MVNLGKQLKQIDRYLGMNRVNRIVEKNRKMIIKKLEQK